LGRLSLAFFGFFSQCDLGGRGGVRASASVHNEYIFFAGFVILQFIVLPPPGTSSADTPGYVNFGTAAFFALGA